MSRILSSFAGFWEDASPDARKALWAASMGWLLDAFDVMLYALILTSVIADLGLTRAQGGLMASLTLAASAVGGLIFGVVADKLGRTRALSLSILLYSVFTFACGFAQSVKDAGQLTRVAFNVMWNFVDFGGCKRFVGVPTQALAQGAPRLGAMVVVLGIQPRKQGSMRRG